MAQTISGTVSSISRFLQQSTQPLGITYTGNPVRDFEKTFQSTDVTKLYFNSYSVVAGTPVIIDLTTLVDAYGVAISFNTVKHLQVINNDPANNLTVGGGTNPLLAALPVLVGQAGTVPGSCVNLTTVLTVSGTTKNLQLQASAGTVSVDVFIVGN